MRLELNNKKMRKPKRITRRIIKLILQLTYSLQNRVNRVIEFPSYSRYMQILLKAKMTKFS